MSNGLVGSTDSNKELVLKSLSVMLEKDLNIETEVSYVSQIILKSLAMMNEVFQTSNVLPVDEGRLNNIANKIIGIIANGDVKTDTKVELPENWSTVKEEINQLLNDENVTKLELDYIKDLIFNSFTNFNNTLSNSIMMATEKAESKALGVEQMSDLSLKKLDEFLKS